MGKAFKKEKSLKSDFTPLIPRGVAFISISHSLQKRESSDSLNVPPEILQLVFFFTVSAILIAFSAVLFSIIMLLAPS